MATTLSTISCMSPEFSVANVREMTVPFHVSVGASMKSKERIFFTYYPEPTVDQISSTSGPVTGSEISVVGRGFFDSSDMICLFIGRNGSSTTVASFVNETYVTCDVAPAQESGSNSGDSVTVTVSLNGQQVPSSALNGPRYTYWEPFSLTGVNTGVLVASVQSSVVFTGKNLNEGCVCVVNGVLTSPTYITSTSISCPIHPSDDSVGSMLSVGVTENNKVSDGDFIKIAVVSPLEVLSVYPLSGPVEGRALTLHLKKSTLVAFEAAVFNKTGDFHSDPFALSLHCNFNGTSGGISSPATIDYENALARCIAPAMLSGPTLVGLQMGMDSGVDSVLAISSSTAGDNYFVHTIPSPSRVLSIAPNNFRARETLDVAITFLDATGLLLQDEISSNSFHIQFPAPRSVFSAKELALPHCFFRFLFVCFLLSILVISS